MYLHLSVDKQRKNNVGGITGKGFKPGQSGNPKGRAKKGNAIADILNELLEKKKDGKTVRTQILEKVTTMALSGDRWAVEFLADRTEGKALERVQKEKVKGKIIIE